MRFWIRDQIACQLSNISRIISRRWSASNSERAGSLRRCLRGLRYWLTVEALRCTWPSIHSWLMLSRWKWRLLLHLIRSGVSADTLTSSLEFQEVREKKEAQYQSRRGTSWVYVPPTRDAFPYVSSFLSESLLALPCRSNKIASCQFE